MYATPPHAATSTPASQGHPQIFPVQQSSFQSMSEAPLSLYPNALQAHPQGWQGLYSDAWTGLTCSICHSAKCNITQQTAETSGAIYLVVSYSFEILAKLGFPDLTQGHLGMGPSHVPEIGSGSLVSDMELQELKRVC